MGYTHYWRQKGTLDQKKFGRIVEDFLKVKAILEKHYKVILAGPMGTGDPIITKDEIMFNGDSECGHPKQELGITWPSKHASGVANQFTDNVIDGNWFAGKNLSERTCGGDCSHESFVLHRSVIKHAEDWRKPDEKEMFFSFCKTAFKPYDLAVLCILIIAKRHLEDDIVVSSDGMDEQWYDGKYICHMMLGYGFEYLVDRNEGELQKMKEVKS